MIQARFEHPFPFIPAIHAECQLGHSATLPRLVEDGAITGAYP